MPDADEDDYVERNLVFRGPSDNGHCQREHVVFSDRWVDHAQAEAVRHDPHRTESEKAASLAGASSVPGVSESIRPRPVGTDRTLEFHLMVATTLGIVFVTAIFVFVLL